MVFGFCWPDGMGSVFVRCLGWYIKGNDNQPSTIDGGAKLDAVRFARATGHVPQNVNFALNVGIIKGFLDANGIDYERGEHGGSIGVPEIAERAKPSIAYIECSR